MFHVFDSPGRSESDKKDPQEEEPKDEGDHRTRPAREEEERFEQGYCTLKALLAARWTAGREPRTSEADRRPITGREEKE